MKATENKISVFNRKIATAVNQLQNLNQMEVSMKRMLLVLLTFSALTFSQSKWVWRNPLPQGNNLNSVALVNNQYIAVGVYGTMLSSSDGINWTSQSCGTTMSLYCVTYGGNQYLAVGVPPTR